MARIGPGIRNKPRILQDICADCGATDPGWSSLNRGILICDGCCSVHRSLGRHISQVKSLRKGSWHPAQLAGFLLVPVQPPILRLKGEAPPQMLHAFFLPLAYSYFSTPYMVHALNSSGANHIWEHTLLDPSSAKVLRRKPQPKDPIHPNKADFIRAKHQMMSFVYRPNKEENGGVEKDASRQLHASVRTANVETSLRLLSLGADPNYFNEEKGNYPLHVAATAGQPSQVEILVIYGADPGTVDKDGQTPVDCARDGNFLDIAERLVEFEYELTDRLSFYLCGKKPDHTSGQHWVIPEMSDTPVESSETSKEARSRLIALPNHSFEELCCDVYDEVDRRETDAIWLSLQNQSALLSDRCSVPFLPVNPEYSSTRNQGRQKLARFNAREFATLIIDLLVEARRRMTGNLTATHPLRDRDQKDATVTPLHHHLTLTNTSSSTSFDRNNAYRQTCPTISSRHGSPSLGTYINTQSQPQLSGYTTSITALHPLHSTSATSTPSIRPLENDDEPLYDSVASEDDYSSWERRKKIQNQQDILNMQSNPRTNLHDSDYQEVDIPDYEDIPESSPLYDLFRDSFAAVDSSDKKHKEMEFPATVSLEEYLEMKRHLELSESRIKELQDNNIIMSARLNELSTMVHTLKEENDCLRLQGSSSSLAKPSEPPPSYYPTTSLHSSPSHRSYSPYFESPTHSLQNGDCGHNTNRFGNVGAATTCGSSSSSNSTKQQRPYSMFESRERTQHPQSISTCSDNFANPYCYDSAPSKGAEPLTENSPLMANLPSQDEVVRKTEVITKKIQDLLISAQDSQHERFVPCSEQINFAVREMADIFPKSGCPPEVWSAVHQLVMSAARLQGECRNHVTSQLHVLDPSRVTQQVIQCAYDIAKAAKSLVTHFQ